ncbi:hypothetical protein Lser_V15G23468 [Lactuca serriola]
MFHGVKMIWKMHDDENDYQGHDHDHQPISKGYAYDDTIDGDENWGYNHGVDASMDGDDDDDDDDSGIAPAA